MGRQQPWRNVRRGTRPLYFWITQKVPRSDSAAANQPDLTGPPQGRGRKPWRRDSDTRPGDLSSETMCPMFRRPPAVYFPEAMS